VSEGYWYIIYQNASADLQTRSGQEKGPGKPGPSLGRNLKTALDETSREYDVP
jgi:hypothetical protein